MTKEFNLSEEIEDLVCPWCKKMRFNDRVPVNKIKEFIKRLKDMFDLGNPTQARYSQVEFECEIDKLAGDDLK